jgi:hypothetical protein
MIGTTTRIVFVCLVALGSAAPAVAAKKTVTPESIKEDLIAARCKSEAKKYYSLVQIKKRRTYEKECIERAVR